MVTSSRPIRPRTFLVVLLQATLIATVAACGVAEPGSDAWVDEQVEQATERLQASDGGRRILDVIDAHGGLRSWYAAPTSAYAWEYSNLGSNMRFESYLVADNRTRHVYHDLLTFGTPEAVEDVEARFAWDGSDAWMSPASRTQPNPRFWSLTGYYFNSIPFVLADPGLGFRILEPEPLEGVMHERVLSYFDTGVGDSPGDVYVVYIDPNTDRVAAVLYTVTFGRAYEATDDGPPAPESGTLLHYREYATVDGLTVPVRFEGYAYQDGVQGALRNEAWTSDISFRAPFDESRLQMPDDARIEPYSVE